MLIEKCTITPLFAWHGALPALLPFDLGSGFAVENASAITSQLEFGERWTSEAEQEKITRWSICLVHRYRGDSGLGESDHHSEMLIRYVAAHLRIICPTKMNAGAVVQGDFGNDAFHLIKYTSHVSPIFIEDCEVFFQVESKHLEQLRRWMNFIVALKSDWQEWYPLYQSQYLSEKAYLEEDPRVRHLFRVMALEALFNTENEYGGSTLIPRLKSFLGRDCDLYDPYRSAFQQLPTLPLRSVAREICELRNKVAHGMAIPVTWKQSRTYNNKLRGGSLYSLAHVDVLREGATAMLSLSWKRILDEQLYETFADKTRMRTFFTAAK